MALGYFHVNRPCVSEGSCTLKLQQQTSCLPLRRQWMNEWRALLINIDAKGPQGKKDVRTFWRCLCAVLAMYELNVYSNIFPLASMLLGQLFDYLRNLGRINVLSSPFLLHIIQMFGHKNLKRRFYYMRKMGARHFNSNDLKNKRWGHNND